MSLFVVAAVLVAAHPANIAIGPHALLTVCLGMCDDDARFDGLDIRDLVACHISGGPGCACWDLNDNAQHDANDIDIAVNTLLGDLPYAVADHHAVASNQQLLANVLTNDLDPRGPGSTAQLVLLPMHGTADLQPNGALIYTPDPNYGGPDSFTYRAVNGYGMSAPATVHINITLVCPAGFGNCDGIAANGCESPLNTLANCGTCGIPCSLPNAVESCATGTCLLTGCDSGFSNCDADPSNGCEVAHAVFTNTCGSAEYVGAACGDTQDGSFCPSTSYFTLTTRSGRNSRWFRALAQECSSCNAPIEARILLAVPAGVNYDVYVYSGCGGTLMGQSTNGPGQAEQVTVSRSDNIFGADDSYNYWVEVRYVSGASCSNWTLTFQGRN